MTDERNRVDELRCHDCSEVIGVYEPMIVLADGVPVRTSRAALADAPPVEATCFHPHCFARAHGD
jgi:hypothetical protein